MEYGPILIACWLLAACASRPRTDAPPTLAEQIGLEPTDAHSEVVNVAVVRTNAILGSDIPFRLQLAAECPMPVPFDTAPVILAARVEPSQGICYVPIGTKYIVVDASQIPALSVTLSGGFADGVTLDPERLLTICLLHECGHLFYGDFGAALDAAVDEFNDAATPEKDLELRADMFAADQIRAAMTEHFPSGRFTGAAMLSVELQTVSFNLTGKRAIDNFGKSTLRPREVFLDDSYTHPNLELRMLLINHFIAPSEQSAALVEEFQRGRRRASNPYALHDRD